jgi:hypothetical protein
MNANTGKAIRLVCSGMFLAAIVSFCVLLPPAAASERSVTARLTPKQLRSLERSWARKSSSQPAPVRIQVPYSVGDVFVSSGPGIVKVFDQAGNLKQTLNNGRPIYTTTGSAFDAAGNFYVTTFSDSRVSKFDTNGNLVNATFMTSDPASDGESIVRDASGNFFVGQADGTRQILKFDGTTGGAPIATYAPTTGPRGTDWIDLAADQKTIYYTSEGPFIRRFDTAANAQLADFNTIGSGDEMYGLRILPDGGVLVANTSNVLRYNSSGNVVHTYAVGSGLDVLFALNRDPDGTSFWTAEIISGDVFKVDIATGAILQSWNANPPGDAAGLSIFGELTVATAFLTPKADTNFVGQTHTVTATVTENGNPAPGRNVTFTIVSGPNAGHGGTCSVDPGCNTDSTGQVSFTYQGTGGVGTDTICATFTPPRGNPQTDCGTKTWLRPPCTLDCSTAFASPAVLWPPNHEYRTISIQGVTMSGCEGDTLLITPTRVTQDEPVNTRGDGNTCPDAQIVGGQVAVRAERTGDPGVPGNGRVYTIHFTATAGSVSCEGAVTVCVPHDQSNPTCVDDRQRYNSLGSCTGRLPSVPAAARLSVNSVASDAAEFTFELPTDAHVNLAVYDVAGRRLATLENANLPSGAYKRTWNMAGLANGMYFVRIVVNGVVDTRTVIKAR